MLLKQAKNRKIITYSAYSRAQVMKNVVQQDITIGYIEHGNPQQNAYVEHYNRTMRYDWLNQELFDNLYQVRQQA